MSTPPSAVRPASRNLGTLLREPFMVMSEEVRRRLVEQGYADARLGHGAVFAYLDAAGTRVSVLAGRAGMTKQAMAELVAHLEARGYVERLPDPSDGRANLVRATRRGRRMAGAAGGALTEIEAEWAGLICRRKLAQLRRLLEELNAALEEPDAARGAAKPAARAAGAAR
jgi:DNA-binding MarR family transcriptional regulator